MSEPVGAIYCFDSDEAITFTNNRIVFEVTDWMAFCDMRQRSRAWPIVWKDDNTPGWT